VCPKTTARLPTSSRQSDSAAPKDVTPDMRLLLDAIDQQGMVSITDGDGIIVYVNTVFARSAGISESDLIGKPHSTVGSGAHPDDFFAALWETIEKGEIWRGRMQNQSAAGELFWVDTTIVPFPAEDRKSTRYVALHTDITDTVALENKLREANLNLADIGKIQSNFLAAMSHDLRTPLNSIIGFTDIINEGMFGPIGNDRYADYLTSVNGSARHLLTLVNDILDFSIMEATGYKFQLERYDPVEQTRGVAKTFDWIAREKHLTIDVIGGDRVPSTVLADPRVATQIQTNLISNACRHSPEGGVVKITWDRDANGDPFLQVDNEGDPIPDEVIREIGRPFMVRNPLHASDTEKSHGLGLYICYRFVEARGGKLDISRNNGVGARVRATWPADVLKPEPT